MLIKSESCKVFFERFDFSFILQDGKTAMANTSIAHENWILIIFALVVDNLFLLPFFPVVPETRISFLYRASSCFPEFFCE